MTSPEMIPPEVEYGINRNVFTWASYELEIEADRITEEGKCELYFFHVNGTKDEKGKPLRQLLHMGNANLMSSRLNSEFSKELADRVEPAPDWKTILTCVSRMTMRRLRQGQPANIITGEPFTRALHYTVYPLLEKDHPTTVFAPGASGKSYLADLICILVQFGIPLKTQHWEWRAVKGNVLYLDWEGTQPDHERRIWAIKQGLGLDDTDTDGILMYRSCTLPLVADIANIQKLVSEAGISLIIVDSQMAASGYGPDAAQLGQHYYNALKSLNVTSLTIDHVAKGEWKGESELVGPYGSVVKYNRARSLFQMTKKQYSGEPYIDVAFQHKKHNEGLLLSPFGMRVTFTMSQEERDTLDMVRFTSIDPEDVVKGGDIEKDQPKDKLYHLILNALNKPKTVEQIAQEISKSEAATRSILHRYSDNQDRYEQMFHRDGDHWSSL